MIKRKKTKQIFVGNVPIGGNADIAVQSMCNTPTWDVKKTVSQIKELEAAGCEIIRVAVPDKKSADALKEIKQNISIPLIADIHFDYRLALASIENGVDALRINPGNIGKEDFIRQVVEAARKKHIPIRIGVNSGSLEKEFSHLEKVDAMVASAMKNVEILEKYDFDMIKISLKASDVLTTIEAYEKISEKTDYPLHVGITEAGTLKSGLIKSSIGIGAILLKGIGDTIRVSLTAQPKEEVFAAYELLKSLKLRNRGVNLISCPTCGRTKINLIELAHKVEEIVAPINKPLTIAVMGCPVNGPGEAKGADIGIAGGIGEGYIFKKGEIIKKVPEQQLLDEFKKELNSMI